VGQSLLLPQTRADISGHIKNNIFAFLASRFPPDNIG